MQESKLLLETERRSALGRIGLGVIISALLAACGGASASPATTPSSSEGSETGRIVATSEPPQLTEETIASDAANPALIVDPASAWVVVPSFRIAVAMPTGWLWTDSEGLLTSIRGANVQLTDADQQALRRGLQAAAEQARSTDPTYAGRVIPSVRVMLVPGGLPAGSRLPANVCTTMLLPQLQRYFPDARVTSDVESTLFGRATVRCRFDYTVDPSNMAVPGRSEGLLIFGESNVLSISSVGGTIDPVGPTLDSVMASARQM